VCAKAYSADRFGYPDRSVRPAGRTGGETESTETAAEEEAAVGRAAAVAVLGLVVFGLAIAVGGAIVASAVGGDGTPAATGAGWGAVQAGAGGGVHGGGARGAPAVPAAWEAIDQGAAGTCRGLGWSVLAAIGRVESDSGRSTLPGVASGANAFGAEGPMQFEPATFASYGVVGPGGATPPSPYDPVDAIYTAARLLCADGAGTPAGLYGAVWAYDHSASYVETVLVLAHALAAEPALGSVPAAAITFAALQLGTPYRWGGTGGGGYDCSGLVLAAYRSAGVSLPRVAQEQFDAGPAVLPGAAVLPGDLVFFGASPRAVSHVGIYIGGGEMIDAPHTGTVVRVQQTPTAPGAPWGADAVIGETRPWG
jgi:cell wall-associated NlpC family hydrolase